MNGLGETDQLFHEAIVAASHNEVLVGVLELLSTPGACRCVPLPMKPLTL